MLLKKISHTYQKTKLNREIVNNRKYNISESLHCVTIITHILFGVYNTFFMFHLKSHLFIISFYHFNV